MKLGDTRFGALVRLTVDGMVIFGISGVVLVLVMSWAERTWPLHERRRVTEADLRPARANFRPIEGELPAWFETGSHAMLGWRCRDR